MIHLLDKQNDLTIYVLDNNLDDRVYWDDVHIDSENQYETFDFTARSDVQGAEHITGQNRVLIKGDKPGTYREFVIFDTFRQTGSAVEVKSNGSYTELSKEPQLLSFNLGGISPEGALAYGLNDTEWQIGNVEYAPLQTIESEGAIDRYTYLVEVAKKFGMVLLFRVEISGHQIVGRFVDMVHTVGIENGKEIVLGKDLVGITRHESTQNIVTALLVQGPEDEFGGRVSINVMNEEARQRWGRNGRHRWGYFEVEAVGDEVLTEAMVRERGEAHLNTLMTAIVQYEVEAVALEHVFGLSHERALKGDAVRIKDTSFTPPLYMDARIISVERSPSNPKAKKFFLGDFIEYSEDEILSTFRKLQKDLANKLGLGDVVAEIEARGIYRGPVAPANPTADALWMDTSVVPNVLKRWNGVTWVKASPTVPSDIGAETPEQTQARIDALALAVGLDLDELLEALDTFENTINSTFRDGIIEEAEAKAIEKYKNGVNSEKADVDSRYADVYGNILLTGTPKTNLLSAKNALNTAHTNLINSINTAIADSRTTAAEKADVDSKFTAYNSAMGTLSTRFEQALSAIVTAQAQSTSTMKAAIMQLRIEVGTISSEDTSRYAEVEELNSNQWLQGNAVLTVLNQSYQTFTDARTALANAINTAVADDNLLQSEETTINGFRTTYRTALTNLIKEIRTAEDEVIRVSANEVMEFGERKIFKGPQTPNPAQVENLDLWLDATISPPVWRQYLNNTWTIVSRTSLSQMNGQVDGSQIAPNSIVTNMISVAGLDAGVISFGTMTGITADVSQAGMTAQGTTSNSVRFWAGSSYFLRDSAPFRVMQSGEVVASNMRIVGGLIEGTQIQTDNSNGTLRTVIGDGEVQVQRKTGFNGSIMYRAILTGDDLSFTGSFQYTRLGISRLSGVGAAPFQMPDDVRFFEDGSLYLTIDRLDSITSEIYAPARMLLRSNIGRVELYNSSGGDTMFRGYQNGNAASLLKWSTTGLQIRTSTDGALASIQASAFSTTSLEEYKEDIQPLGRLLDKMRSTPLFDYVRTEAEEGRENTRQLGVLYAQAPDEIKDTAETVDIVSMISLLWRTMQEMADVLENAVVPGTLGSDAGEVVAQQVNHAMKMFVQSLPEEQALEVAGVFPQWEVNISYKIGNRVQYGVNGDNEPQLWVVLQNHQSQANFTPDTAVSLFKKIGFTETGVPLWVQPVGSTDAYQLNDVVSFNGQQWKSTINANVWQPGVYGWTVVA